MTEVSVQTFPSQERAVQEAAAHPAEMTVSPELMEHYPDELAELAPYIRPGLGDLVKEFTDAYRDSVKVQEENFRNAQVNPDDPTHRAEITKNALHDLWGAIEMGNVGADSRQHDKLAPFLADPDHRVKPEETNRAYVDLQARIALRNLLVRSMEEQGGADLQGKHNRAGALTKQGIVQALNGEPAPEPSGLRGAVRKVLGKLSFSSMVVPQRTGAHDTVEAELSETAPVPSEAVAPQAVIPESDEQAWMDRFSTGDAPSEGDSADAELVEDEPLLDDAQLAKLQKAAQAVGVNSAEAALEQTDTPLWPTEDPVNAAPASEGPGVKEDEGEGSRAYDTWAHLFPEAASDEAVQPSGEAAPAVTPLSDDETVEAPLAAVFASAEVTADREYPVRDPSPSGLRARWSSMADGLHTASVRAFEGAKSLNGRLMTRRGKLGILAGVTALIAGAALTYRLNIDHSPLGDVAANADPMVAPTAGGPPHIDTAGVPNMTATPDTAALPDATPLPDAEVSDTGGLTDTGGTEDSSTSASSGIDTEVTTPHGQPKVEPFTELGEWNAKTGAGSIEYIARENLGLDGVPNRTMTAEQFHAMQTETQRLLDLNAEEIAKYGGADNLPSNFRVRRV
jgi:hypothetical protein